MTLEQLQAMPDSELDALAAKAMGWTKGTYATNTLVRYFNPVTQEHTYWSDKWHPTADRNQSGALLGAMAARGTRGAEFVINVKAGTGDAVAWDANTGRWNVVIGNSPRSEVLAALLAWSAMEEK